MCEPSGRAWAVCEASPSKYEQPLTFVPRAPSRFFSLMHGHDKLMQRSMRLAMQAIDTQDYAQLLFEKLGDKSIVVAAKKACSFEEKGNNTEAKTWRGIEAALKLMRGPHQS
jgi:hypothetical protein